MGNLNSFQVTKKATGFIGGLLLMFFSVNLGAQTTHKFKVESPTEAKPLQQDSINNILSFSPVFAEGKTYLRWLVENDRKDGVFIVERSDDGDTFEALGFKDRVGTDKKVNLFYSFVDETPPAGYAHYRVMQVGTDHSFNYSSVVRVKTTAAEATGGKAEAPSEGK